MLCSLSCLLIELSASLIFWLTQARTPPEAFTSDDCHTEGQFPTVI